MDMITLCKGNTPNIQQNGNDEENDQLNCIFKYKNLFPNSFVF